jgi:hypothetical protein
MAKKVEKVLEDAVVNPGTQGFGSRDFHSTETEEVVVAPQEVVAPVVEEEITK